MEETKEIISILQDIQSSLGENGTTNITIALIAASSALAGGIITSIIQYLTTKHTEKSNIDALNIRLKAELVSKQRQEWMDSVRENAANLLAEYDHVFALITDKTQNNQDKLNELHLATARKAIYLQLKLNPKKPVQKTFIDSLEKLLMLFQYAMFKPDEDHSKTYDDCRKSYIKNLNELFEQTWKRIKNLE